MDTACCPGVCHVLPASVWDLVLVDEVHGVGYVFSAGHALAQAASFFAKGTFSIRLVFSLFEKVATF